MIDLTLGHYSPQVATHKPRAVRPSGEYVSPMGLPPLRRAIAAINGVDVASVAITAGASGALLATLVAHRPKGHLLLPRPWFPGYVGISGALGISTTTYDVDDNAATNLVNAAASNMATTALWNMPHNPTGRCELPGERDKLEQLIDDGTFIIEDRAYDPVAHDPRIVQHAAATLSHLVVGSMSKSLALAGERIGYVIGHPETVASVAASSWNVLMSVSAASQQVALQTLADDHGEAHWEARRLHRQEAARLARLTFGSLVPGPGDAPYFIWLKFPGATLPSADLASACLERGVRVSPGDLFGERDPSVRISLVSATLPDVKVGMGLVGAVLGEVGLLTAS
jgi:aspartate/methionine/tyrosine aminotransferase